jgi:hypothetical protein
MTAMRISRRGPVFRFTSGDGATTRPGSGARAAVRLSKLGLRGAPGDDGEQGPQGIQGPPGIADDPGDLTLLFDNKLI